VIYVQPKALRISVYTAGLIEGSGIIVIAGFAQSNSFLKTPLPKYINAF